MFYIKFSLYLNTYVLKVMGKYVDDDDDILTKCMTYYYSDNGKFSPKNCIEDMQLNVLQGIYLVDYKILLKQSPFTKANLNILNFQFSLCWVESAVLTEFKLF